MALVCQAGSGMAAGGGSISIAAKTASPPQKPQRAAIRPPFRAQVMPEAARGC
jgi:hypothetical protein